MKEILHQQRFFILAVLLLIGLMLVTLPVSHAVWREVLGVVADVDTIDKSITITPVPPIEVSDLTAIPESSTTEPVSELAPTDPPTLDAAPTEIAPTIVPPTDEPIATEAPPTELPTEPPTDVSTPEHTEN